MDIDRKKLFKNSSYLIFFIFIVHAVATKLHWYSLVWWIDMPMHFLGGFWLGLLGAYLFRLKEKSVGVIFKILLFVLLIGVGWEVFEILVNDVTTKYSFDSLDTFSDICFDLFGGLCAILYVLAPFKKERALSKE